MDQTVDVGRRETKTSINTRMESHSQLKFVEYTWFDTECERVFKRPYLRQMSKCTERIPKNMSRKQNLQRIEVSGRGLCSRHFKNVSFIKFRSMALEISYFKRSAIIA